MIAAMPRPAPSHRADYRGFHPVATRWADNDAYGHMNNAIYFSLFDTAVTAWLMARGLIGQGDGPMWVVAEAGCRYLAELGFPDALEVGLRVGRMGASSVRWELGLFREGEAQASAEAHFVHVHVARQGRRAEPIPAAMRGALEGLML